MWKILGPLAIVLVVTSPAAATRTTVMAKTAPKLALLKAAAELPLAVDVAVKAGASEVEVGRSLRGMKERKVEGEAALEVAKHFKKQADDGNSDRGLSGVVHECIVQGKRGTELVACVREGWDKKPKVKMEGKGEPGEVGKPDDKGPPEDKGKAEDKGKPGDKGKKADKAKPDHAPGGH
jgi:hypothetical protein